MRRKRKVGYVEYVQRNTVDISVQIHNVAILHRLTQLIEQRRGVNNRLSLQGRLVGTEIGVDRAYTSQVLLKFFPDLTLFMVDPLTVYPQGDPYWLTGDRRGRRNRRLWHEVYQEVCARVRPFGERAILLRERSLAGAVTVAEKIRLGHPRLDFVFVDANHSYQAVQEDIAAWLPLLSKDGIMMGHDYGNQPCPEVKPAVDDMARQYQRTVEVDVGYVWAFRERGPLS